MIYLNQAATSFPKPRRVLDAHAAFLYKVPSGQFRSSNDTGDDVFKLCRVRMGKLLGIQDSNRIFFTSGATASSNALIYGLYLRHMHVITTATEHNSILRPLLNLNEQVGSVSIAPCDENGYVFPEEIEKLIKGNTKAIFINHCSNVTGMIQDIEAIGEIAKQHGIMLVVDCSQSAGAIPIDADKMGIDALIFTGHKSLFGVQGTGGFYLRKGIDLKPYQFGGTGLDSSRLLYEEEPYEYEVGTQNTAGIAALSEGAAYILERGVSDIFEKKDKLMHRIYKGLKGLSNVRIYGHADKNKGAVISFNIGGLKPADTAYILQNGYDIIVRTGLHCAPLIHSYIGADEFGTVRVSISDMTTDDEVAIFLKAVKEISESVVIK